MSLRLQGSQEPIRFRCPHAGHFAFVALLCLVSAIAAAQASAPQASNFVGTWKADFKKQTWLTLELVESKGALTGTLTHSTYLSSDNEGDITSVGEEMSNDTVAKAEFEGAVLHLTTRDEDNNLDRYDLTLTGPDTADLQPLTNDGSAAPKAFKLKRAVRTPAVPSPK